MTFIIALLVDYWCFWLDEQRWARDRHIRHIIVRCTSIYFECPLISEIMRFSAYIICVCVCVRACVMCAHLVALSFTAGYRTRRSHIHMHTHFKITALEKCVFLPNPEEKNFIENVVHTHVYVGIRFVDIYKQQKCEETYNLEELHKTHVHTHVAVAECWER